MYQYLKERRKLRAKRALRVRKKLRGSALKPRLSLYKSNRNLFAQLIDDEQGKTLVSYGTQAKSGDFKGKSKKENAKLLGEKIAFLAKKNEIEKVVFDRGYHKYHGILAEFANAAREAGLKF